MSRSSLGKRSEARSIVLTSGGQGRLIGCEEASGRGLLDLNFEQHGIGLVRRQHIIGSVNGDFYLLPRARGNHPRPGSHLNCATGAHAIIRVNDVCHEAVLRCPKTFILDAIC